MKGQILSLLIRYYHAILISQSALAPRLVLGRMHQSGFFEHLLQGDMAQRRGYLETSGDYA